jgi:hypothetical protein
VNELYAESRTADTDRTLAESQTTLIYIHEIKLQIIRVKMNASVPHTGNDRLLEASKTDSE